MSYWVFAIFLAVGYGGWQLDAIRKDFSKFVRMYGEELERQRDKG